MTDKTLALFPASLIRAPRCAAAYLPMALQRPNVFPKGDLALAIATQKLKDLAVSNIIILLILLTSFKKKFLNRNRYLEKRHRFVFLTRSRDKSREKV